MIRLLLTVFIAFACVKMQAEAFFNALVFPYSVSTSTIVAPTETGDDARALFRSGVCKLRGISCKVDKQAAVMDFTKAMFLGSDEARFAFALCQFYGYGIQRNSFASLKTLRQLHKKGFLPATRQIVLFAIEDKVKLQDDDILSTLRKSAEKGDAQSS